MNELQTIGKKIINLPGRPLFMLDKHVAELYGVETRALNQAMKRNPGRFPEDFVFQLTADEVKKVITNCDNLEDLKFNPILPYGYPREGCNMLATVLHTPVAIDRSIWIVRAFTAYERFAPQRSDKCFVDAPDTPELPSGLQMFALMEMYGKEEAKQIMKDYHGIYPGGGIASITPIEARTIKKTNPNKKLRNKVLASLFDRGISKAVLVLASGMSEKSIYNAIHAGRMCAGYQRRLNATER
jgi:hypothetical protein